MESENLNGKNGIDGFTSEFEQFFDAMSEKVREVNVEQIVTLYAIYLKNGLAV